ncbi:MAG: D-aminoacyl-tRNA deacylase [Bacteroidales bacterium]|jgi:D-tyrosyl-tRNA(Tyr) deacylase|nr:D-aminoacyl-tRNA deacylase [Bacteroidales bacterium]
MRLLIQRVKNAYVEIDNQRIAEIGAGLLIFLGIETLDSSEDVEWLVAKVSKIRIFDDDQGVMNRAVSEVFAQILVVSQFTLHASTKKGNRPSYIKAARPETAIPLYELFVKQIEIESGCVVKTGVFGAMMNVGLVNDGPVTIIIDSKAKE